MLLSCASREMLSVEKPNSNQTNRAKRTRGVICGLLAGGLVVVGLSSSTLAANNTDNTNAATLKAEATVSKKAAKRTALAEVMRRGLPHPRIKDAELEREKGLLIWSFDIATRGTKDITEVQVDAKTGAVVSVSTESNSVEAKERAKEKDNDDKKEKK